MINEALRTASLWLVRIDDGDASPENLAAFDAWLSNPTNERVYIRLLTAWMDTRFFGSVVHDRAAAARSH